MSAKTSHSWVVLVVCLLTHFCFSIVNAQHPGYRFECILSAGENGVDSVIDQAPQITEDGRVLFQAEFDFFDDAIVLANESTRSVVSSRRVLDANGTFVFGPFGSLLGGRQVNGMGDVVSIGDTIGGPRRLYGWSYEDGLEILYRSDGSAENTFDFSIVRQPSVNDRGEVAFIANGQGLARSVFVGDLQGAFPTTVFTSLSFGPFSDLFGVIMPDTGQPVISAERNDLRGIYRLIAPDEFLTIVEENDEFTDLFSFDANNVGQIAFAGRLGNGNRFAAMGDENRVEVIFEEDSQFRPRAEPALNDHGDFVATVDFFKPGQLVSALQVGSDLEADRLITDGDLLCGQKVLALFAGAGGINNQGQIAFYAATFNPESGFLEGGIYRATPRLQGEINHDNKLNLLDIELSKEILTMGSFHSRADLNQDKVVDLQDFVLFVQLLLTQVFPN